MPKSLARRWVARRGVDLLRAILLLVGLLFTQSIMASCTLTDEIGPEMVLLPGGAFEMGAPESERGSRANERPIHTVNIKPFFLSVCEVTRGEFAQFVSETGYLTSAESSERCVTFGRSNVDETVANWKNAIQGQTDTDPVVCASWSDAVKYTQWLSIRTGAKYRLPSEAEWEYAARAGTHTPFYSGECIHTNQANYHGNFGYNDCGAETGEYKRKTVPVESLDAANAWGLRHMAGNVWEWTQDCWHEDYSKAPVDGGAWLESDNGNCERRVLRGGGWGSEPTGLRSAYRFGFNDVAYFDVGFRVARTK